MKQKNGANSGEARLEIILDSMVEAVFVTDDSGRVTMTNEALDQLIDRDVRGRRAKNVIKSKELKDAIRRARKKNEATETEIETEIGDKMHIFHAQVAPLPNDKGVVTVLHDVTGLKDANRIRRDFVSNASHELRTPLTAIRGFAETLLDGAADNPETRQRFLEAILRHTVRLERLAKDLTVLGQAESPQYDWDATLADVSALCRSSASSLESFAKAKGIDLRLKLPDEPLVVPTSPHALDHVLVNLVENAIKYSPKGAAVDIALRSDSDGLVLEVKDEGPGIPQKYHERIFERFYRVDKGRSREEGGTGLGLSIVRNLVQRLGGTIELESEPGEGALFRVSVPFAETVEANGDA